MKVMMIALVFGALNALSSCAVPSGKESADTVLAEFDRYISDIKEDKPILGYFSRAFLEDRMDMVSRADADLASRSLTPVRATIRFGEGIHRVLNKSASCKSAHVCEVSVDFCTPRSGFNNYKISYRRKPSSDDSAYEIYRLELLLDRSKSKELCQ